MTKLMLVQLVALAAAYGVHVVTYFLQRSHLRQMPKIETDAQVDAFMTFVRFQMQLAFLFICCVIPALAGALFHSFGKPLVALLIMWAPYAGLILTGVLLRLQEEKLQSRARCSAYQLPEFEKICHDWRNKWLPDF